MHNVSGMFQKHIRKHVHAFTSQRKQIEICMQANSSIIDIEIEWQCILLGHTLAMIDHGNDVSHGVDKQSLQDTPAILQVRQENKTCPGLRFCFIH